MENNSNILTKTFFILKANEVNKNFRKYPLELIQEWLKTFRELSQKNDPDDIGGFEVEYAIDESYEKLEYSYINSNLACGVVTDLFLNDNNELYGTASFFIKGPFAEKIYSEDLNLDDCVLVPKGDGGVLDGIVTEYELFGFNLVKKEQSSFVLLPEESKQIEDLIIEESKQNAETSETPTKENE